MTMRVAELWRYPVKSLRGEQLAQAELLADGILGDRLVHVRAPEGRTITSRTKPGLLGLAGTLGADGVPLIENRPWNHPLSIAAVEAAAGAGATLVLADGPERFDVLPLSILTDGRSTRSESTGAGCGRTSSSAASTAWPSATGPAASCGSDPPSSPS